jgi:hypothetical protein
VVTRTGSKHITRAAIVVTRAGSKHLTRAAIVVTRTGSKHLTTPLLINDCYCGYCHFRTTECRAINCGYIVGNNLFYGGSNLLNLYRNYERSCFIFYGK